MQAALIDNNFILDKLSQDTHAISFYICTHLVAWSQSATNHLVKSSRKDIHKHDFVLCNQPSQDKFFLAFSHKKQDVLFQCEFPDSKFK